jgi:hypothetical protein
MISRFVGNPGALGCAGKLHLVAERDSQYFADFPNFAINPILDQLVDDRTFGMPPKCPSSRSENHYQRWVALSKRAALSEGAQMNQPEMPPARWRKPQFTANTRKKRSD